MATTADGLAERDAALLMLNALGTRRPRWRRTMAADKGYDVAAFVDVMRHIPVRFV